MTGTSTPPRPTTRPRRDGFGPTLRSEWTKFRTVRGWLIGLVIAAALCVVFTFLVANGKHEGSCIGTSPSQATCQVGHPFVPTGPDGEAVADSYQFVEQPLAGNGTVTARVNSLTGLMSTNPANEAPSVAATRPGLVAWAKAGILLTPSIQQGSPYAAIMATGGQGVRFQDNYTHDQRGATTNSFPRWLRLIRTGDTLTGYESNNDATWTPVGSAHLSGLPATVIVGLFVTSPVSFEGSSGGAATQATATFDHVTLEADSPTDTWQSQSIGTGPQDFYPTLGAGSAERSGDTFVVTGSGDIAPAVGSVGGDTASNSLFVGLIVSLIVIIVIAAMFITVEYRRGLIRTTFTATPRRGRVLVAKAVVIGVVAFVIGAVAAAVAVPLGDHLLKTNGNFVFPASALTVARIIAGCGALVAVTAVAVLALGAVLRRSAGAVTAGIVVFVLPYIIGSAASRGAGTWLFRLTPAAGFSVLGAFPRSSVVSYPYTLGNGYYPLAPWAGLLVLCAYAAAALALATTLLRRRDA